MVDVIDLDWVFNAQHKEIMLSILQKHNLSDIIDVVIAYLPNYINDNSTMEIPGIYHALFHANITLLYTSQAIANPICKTWIKSFRKQYDEFDRANITVPKIKIFITGDSFVGKTSITNKILAPTYWDTYDPTIYEYVDVIIKLDKKQHEKLESVSFNKNLFKNNEDEDDKYIVLDIKDYKGGEYFRDIEQRLISNNDFFLIVFAVNERDSFEGAKRTRCRILEIKEDCMDLGMVLIGNKCDLRYGDNGELKDGYNFVSSEEAMEYATECHIPYIETSAKNGKNIGFLFHQLVYEYWIQTQTQNLNRKY